MKIQLLSNETSGLGETLQTSPQTINSQRSYDEESRISDIFMELQSFKDFQSSIENNWNHWKWSPYENSSRKGPNG